MQIKTADGTESVASSGVGNAALATGIIGTLGALNNGNGVLGGLFGGGNSTQYATKTDLAYAQELAKKDSEIALLQSEQNTEVKIADVYERIMTRVNSDKNEQQAVNATQAVANAQMAANIAVSQNDIATINSTLGNLTKTIIPITNVCPEPMKLYNSWTAPTTTTTTT